MFVGSGVGCRPVQTGRGQVAGLAAGWHLYWSSGVTGPIFNILKLQISLPPSPPKTQCTPKNN